MVIKRVRGQGGQQAPATALEQADVQLALQLADLLRQRWLGNTQALGGAADMAFLIERDEVAELTKIHKF